MKTYEASVLKYDVIFEEAGEGGYSVSVPSLQGCISEGDSFEEAKTNIAEAITAYLESLQLDGEEIPRDDASVFIGQVSVSIPSLVV